MGHAANIVDVRGEEVGGGVSGASLIPLIICLEVLLMKHDATCYHLLHNKCTLQVNTEDFRWNVDISMQLGHE